MKSLMYRSPLFYIFSLRMIHGRTFDRRYAEILKIVGKRHIFEVGCGPGILGRYTGKELYSGMDLNEKFVRYARKKGYNCILGDILKDDFPDAEVGVAVDILHHITPRERTLLVRLRERYRTVVVVEPVKAYSISMPALMRKLWDALLGDSDGINPFDSRKEWQFTEESLMQYMKKLGAYRVKVVGTDVVAVFNGEGRPPLEVE